MARHRVGDKYLSDEEYKQHQDESWAFLLFFAGLLVFGVLSYFFILPHIPKDSEKWVKISTIAISSISGGILLVKIRNLIAMALGFAFLVGAAWAVISFLGYVVE